VYSLLRAELPALAERCPSPKNLLNSISSQVDQRSPFFGRDGVREGGMLRKRQAGQAVGRLVFRYQGVPESGILSGKIFVIEPQNGAGSRKSQAGVEGALTGMSSMKPKLRLIGAFAALGTLALAVSCRGFFQNPTLSSIAVTPPSPTIETGKTNNTVQMAAFGTYNDGSTGNPSVSWSISPGDGSIATISSGGLVTSVAVGTATVTATAKQNPTITGTQTVTVTECVQSIALDKTSGTISTNNPSLQINANATLCGGGNNNVNSIATWTSSNTSLATVSAGLVTMVAGNTTAGTITITATIGSVTSNIATINVTP
jgi:hypothetical protein